MKSWLAPKHRIALLLAVVNLSWLVAAWFWLDRSPAMWLMALALSINILLVGYDRFLGLARLPARRLEGCDEYGLTRIVQKLAETHKIPEPVIEIVNHPSLHAMSYAKLQSHPRFVFTTGALDRLTSQELEVCVLYQIFCMKSSLNVMNYWTGVMIDIVYRTGLGIETTVRFILGWSPGIAQAIVSPWISFLRMLLMSENDLIILDKMVKTALPESELIAGTLVKMNSYTYTRPWRHPWTFAHMCLVTPFYENGMTRFLSPHPKLSKRVLMLAGRHPL